VNGKGIHPGAHIALDFLISTGLIIAGTFDIIFFVPLEIAAGALEILAGTMHLALFIMACIAVHRWRRLRYPQTAQVIYVQQPPLQQPMMVPIPQNGSLPPPPPGMAYLVPIPPQQGQQQYSAAAHQQPPQKEQQQNSAVALQEVPDGSQKVAGFNGNEVQVEDAPELNARN